MDTINIIHCENCLDTMKGMPDNSVDLSITSPPYNIGKSIHHNTTIYKEYKDNMSDDEYYTFIVNVIDSLLRVTKHYVLFNFQFLSNNKEVYSKIIGKFANNIKEYFVWAKTNPPPSIQETCFASGFEMILCLSNSDFKGRSFKQANFSNRIKGRRIVSNTIIRNTNKEFVEGHYACYPLWLPTFFIKHLSFENDIIYDPFMGSGTTAVAAVKLNRKYIGSEISQEYCDIANKRIQKELDQGNLF